MATEQQTSEKDCADMMKPGEHHKRLDGFVGTWRASVKSWHQPGQPPFESQGEMKSAWVLGGRYLEQRYRSEMMGQPFEGIGYWGYNTVTNTYEAVWMDSMSTMMMFENGGFDGSGTSFTGRGQLANPMTGGTMSKRTVITVKSKDEHLFEMYFGDGAGNEFKTLEILYTRAK